MSTPDNWTDSPTFWYKLGPAIEKFWLIIFINLVLQSLGVGLAVLFFLMNPRSARCKLQQHPLLVERYCALWCIVTCILAMGFGRGAYEESQTYEKVKKVISLAVVVCSAWIIKVQTIDLVYSFKRR